MQIKTSGPIPSKAVENPESE
jgi:G2/mitotic-specific cyclin-B, other